MRVTPQPDLLPQSLYHRGTFQVEAARDFAVIMSGLTAKGRHPTRTSGGEKDVPGLYAHAMGDGKVTRAEMLATLATQASAFEASLAEELSKQGITLNQAVHLTLNPHGDAPVLLDDEAADARLREMLSERVFAAQFEKMALIASHIRTGEAASAFNQASQSPGGMGPEELGATYAVSFTIERDEKGLALGIATQTT